MKWSWTWVYCSILHCYMPYARKKWVDVPYICDISSFSIKTHVVHCTIRVLVIWGHEQKGKEKKELLLSFLKCCFYYIPAMEITFFHSYSCDWSKAKWLNGFYLKRRWDSVSGERTKYFRLIHFWMLKQVSVRLKECSFL